MTYYSVRQSSVLLLALATFLFPIAAKSVTIHYQISGVISDTSRIITPIPGIEIGSAWQVDLTYSGELVNSQPSTISTQYSLVGSSFSIFPSISVDIEPLEVNGRVQSVNLTVGNDIYLGPYLYGDFLEFWASNYLPGGGGSGQPIMPTYTVDGRKLWSAGVRLSDTTNSLWNDTSLMNSVNTSLNKFNDNLFVMTFLDDRVSPNEFESAVGVVESYQVTIIPIPGAGGLFATGIICLLAFHRKRMLTITPRPSPGRAYRAPLM